MSYQFRVTDQRLLEIRERGESSWLPLTQERIRFLAGSHLQELVWDLARALPDGEVAAKIHPTLFDVRTWVSKLSPTARAAISENDMKALDALLNVERLS